MTSVEDLVSSTLPLTLREETNHRDAMRTDFDGRTDALDERMAGFAQADEMEVINFTPEVQDAIQKVICGFCVGEAFFRRVGFLGRFVWSSITLTVLLNCYP